MKSGEMNSELPAYYLSHLDALAKDWLTFGATTFSLWNTEQQPLVCWPKGVSMGADAIVAPIRIGRQTVGELRVTGVSPLAQCKLDGEARLLAQITRLDNELQQMTSELIEVQDQILALYDLTQSTRSHLGISETLRSIAREATRLLRVEGAVLLLAPTLVHYPALLINDQTLQNYFYELQASGHELVLYKGEDAEIEPGVHSACFIPIRVRDANNAMLGLLNKLGGPFRAPDLKLARTIAEHAGAQIEHALLYQEMLAQARLQTEMELARDVQARLLSQRRTQVTGIDVCAEARPALQVGGDFYNLVQQDDGSLTIMLGDVAGKGISAALIMGIVHTVTHNAAKLATRPISAATPSRVNTNLNDIFTIIPTPAAILSSVNNDLYDIFTTVDSFATVFVAQYRPDQGTLTYANAGHAPVILCPAGGSARLLEADGVPIGVLPVSLSADERIPFGPGDVLIVATDGFNEARNPSGEMFGYEQLLLLAESVADQPARTIARALYDAVASFAAGRPSDDDQTLIVLKGNALWAL